MSYLKLPKTTQDHAIGFQSVNQAIDNNAALLTAFDVGHSIGVGGNSPFSFPTRAVGRHDDIVIARTVADFDVTATVLRALVGGPVFGALRYIRIGAGQWQIFLATPQLYGAVALMRATSNNDRKANCFRSTSPSQGPSIYITTWDLGGGVWTATDLPFSLVVWTQLP